MGICIVGIRGEIKNVEIITSYISLKIGYTISIFPQQFR